MNWTVGTPTANDPGVGLAASLTQFPDKSFTVRGPTGGSTVWSVEGSNATTPTGTYFVLSDSAVTGQEFSALSAEGMFGIVENPRWIRFRVSSATAGATTIVCDMTARGAY